MTETHEGLVHLVVKDIHDPYQRAFNDLELEALSHVRYDIPLIDREYTAIHSIREWIAVSKINRLATSNNLNKPVNVDEQDRI